MNPILRDFLLFVAGAIFGYVILIPAFLALMIVTGGAVFAVPVLAAIALGALAIDHFAMRRNATRGWPFSAFAAGFIGLTIFFAVTTRGVT
jgi:hypothetical protein